MKIGNITQEEACELIAQSEIVSKTEAAGAWTTDLRHSSLGEIAIVDTGSMARFKSY